MTVRVDGLYSYMGAQVSTRSSSAPTLQHQSAQEPSVPPDAEHWDNVHAEPDVRLHSELAPPLHHVGPQKLPHTSSESVGVTARRAMRVKKSFMLGGERGPAHGEEAEWI